MKRLLFLGLLLVALPAVTYGAITFDTSTQCTASGADSCTWSHTAAAQQKSTIVVQCRLTAATVQRTISTVTYNSVGLTAGSATQAGTSDGDNDHVETWYRALGTPDGMAHNIVVTLTSSGFDGVMRCWAATAYGVDQTTVVRTGASTTSGTTAITGSPPTQSISPTCSSGDLLIAAIGFTFQGQNSVSNTGSMTTRQDNGSVGLRGTTDTVCETQAFTWDPSGWTAASTTGIALIPATTARPITVFGEIQRVVH